VRSIVGTLLNRVPVPYVRRSGIDGLNLLGRPVAASAEKQMQAYGSVGTLFAIVNRTSNAVAQVEWKLWRKAPSGLKEDRKEVTAHVALDLQRLPNPWMPWQEFCEATQQHIDLTGEGWWVVGRNGSLSRMPLELWPVRPDKMAPKPHPTKFLSGYCYYGPDGEEVPLELDDVIFMRMPNPLDPYRGLGPVQSSLMDLDSERYSAEWNRNFFINGAEPGGIVEVDDSLQDEEFDQMRDRWNAQHRGVGNAHRVAILERGKWVERKFSMRDMQFTELRKASREVIREAFGFPKPMLGATDDVNRANAEAAEVVFSRWLVVPRLERIKAALNRDLLGLFGVADTLEFDYDDPTPPNAETENAERDSRVNAVVALAGAGFDGQTAAEAYELPEGLSWEKPAPPPQLVPGGGPEAEPEDEEAAEEMAARMEAAIRAKSVPVGVLADIAKLADALGRHTHGPRAQDDPLDPEHDDQLDAVNAAWESALVSLLAAWRPVTADWEEELAESIRIAVDAGDVTALSRLAVFTDDATQVLAEHMITLAVAAAEQMADDARAQGVTTDAGEPDEDNLSGYAGAVAGLLGAGLAAAAGREALRLLTPESTGAGLARQVTDFIDGLSDRPLRDQLGGALSNAQNTGRIATLREAPSAAYYANERLDANTCRFCREVDGRWLGNTLEEVERTYPNGGYTECAGRERCRGTVTAVWRPEQVQEGGL
jgi:HK97 family phage portal protein